jgi:hypothetical protein
MEFVALKSCGKFHPGYEAYADLVGDLKRLFETAHCIVVSNGHNVKPGACAPTNCLGGGDETV